ncbi:hypothetical protein ACLEPN_36670 [Myxococcus sp. 1LA]
MAMGLRGEERFPQGRGGARIVPRDEPEPAFQLQRLREHRAVAELPRLGQHRLRFFLRLGVAAGIHQGRGPVHPGAQGLHLLPLPRGLRQAQPERIHVRAGGDGGQALGRVRRGGQRLRVRLSEHAGQRHQGRVAPVQTRHSQRELVVRLVAQDAGGLAGLAVHLGPLVREAVQGCRHALEGGGGVDLARGREGLLDFGPARRVPDARQPRLGIRTRAAALRAHEQPGDGDDAVEQQ